MKFRRMGVVLLLCLTALFPLNALAAEEEMIQELSSDLGLPSLREALPEESAQLLEEWGVSFSSPIPDFPTPGELFSRLTALAATAATAPLQAGGGILTLLLLNGLFCVLIPGGKAGLGEMADFIASLSIGSAVLLPLSSATGAMRDAIGVCSGFMLAFVPVFSALLLAQGKALLAAGSTAAVFTAAQLISCFCSAWLLPASGGLLALSATAGIFPEGGLDSLLEGLHKAILWALGLGMTLFVALLTVTGLGEAAGDSMTLRTSRFLTASLVPVVGGAVSEAISAVAACVGILRSGVGALGLLAVILLLLPTVISLLLWRASLSLCASAAQALGISGAQRILRCAGGVAGVFLAVAVCVGIAFLISIALLLTFSRGG